MKTISVKNPWAYLICTGVKDIENRTWPIKYRGRVLIHTGAIGTHGYYSKFLPSEFWNNLSEEQKAELIIQFQTRSAIIGSVEIVNCVINHESIWAEKTEMPAGCYMGEKPIYNWVLAYPVLFPTPIRNIKGKLSFWDYPGIASEPDEDGKPQCMCQLPIDEEDQVRRMINSFECRYCGGNWYK